MVKSWKVYFGDNPPNGYNANETAEISDAEKQKFQKDKVGMHIMNSAFWKEEDLKPKSKPKSKSKKTKSKGSK